MRSQPRRSVLNSIDRISEVLFGLIMALTFTGSLSVAGAGREDVRTMLAGALGCNLAWGFIDGILYLMNALAENSRDRRTLRALRSSEDADAARRVVADALPPAIGAVVTPEELDAIRSRLSELPARPGGPLLDRDAWIGALGVFIVVVTTTFPVVVPFLFMTNALHALRVSNLIAIVMLFFTGYAFARVIGAHRWLTGVAMVVLGATLVSITMALGG